MNVIDKWNTENGTIQTTEHAIDRRHTAHLAHHLSTVTVQQWEKALTGIMRPNGGGLGVAATTTYGVALLERGFGVRVRPRRESVGR